MTDSITTELFMNGSSCPSSGRETNKIVHLLKPNQLACWAASATTDDADLVMEAGHFTFAAWVNLSYDECAKYLQKAAIAIGKRQTYLCQSK